MKWRSIEKEPIPEGQECLIFVNCDKCGNCNLSNKVFVCEVFERYHPDVKGLPITHWMPLPKPPKVGDT